MDCGDDTQPESSENQTECTNTQSSTRPTKFSQSDHLTTHMRTHTTLSTTQMTHTVTRPTATTQNPFTDQNAPPRVPPTSTTSMQDAHTGHRTASGTTSELLATSSAVRKDHSSARSTQFGSVVSSDQNQQSDTEFNDDSSRVASHESDLNSGVRMHTREKSFECEVCHKKFFRSRYLRIHKRRHTGEKPFECEVCHAKFYWKNDLTRHMRRHAGEKPFECEVCHAKFALKDYLKGHMKTHTDERPHRCQECPATFTHRKSLTDHMKIHWGDGDFKCDKCTASFSRIQELTKHAEIHSGRTTRSVAMSDVSSSK